MPPQQRTILLVDDDHEILESMRMVLENKGFRILAARDGNAGLMIAERENPDLLILDMMMPKKSGFLVLEKLRSRPGGLDPDDHDHRQRGKPPSRLCRDARACATTSASRSPWKSWSARSNESWESSRGPASRRRRRLSDAPCGSRSTAMHVVLTPRVCERKPRCGIAAPGLSASHRLRRRLSSRGLGAGAGPLDPARAARCAVGSPTTPIISIASNGSTVVSFSTSFR